MADLWSVESRWLQVLDRNNMVGEDYRMRAVMNHENLCKEQELTAELEATLAETKYALRQARETIEALKLAQERTLMEHEDYLRHYSRENGQHRKLKREHTRQTSELEQAREETAYHLERLEKMHEDDAAAGQGDAALVQAKGAEASKDQFED